MKLAVFDFDSTLMDGETLEFLAKEMGIETHIKALSKSGYTHGNLKPSVFKPLIEVAIKNSVPYCLSVKDLKESIGTNFSELVKYIQSTGM